MRDRNAERNITDRTVHMPSQNELRERNADMSGIERGSSAVFNTISSSNASQTPASIVTSGLVGDRRISLGAGAGCAGLAAQLEQGYHQAREAVRANNGIKVLLQLLQPRVVTPPGALDCLRALACRVLLGLSRDDTIAHILTRLQVNDFQTSFILEIEHSSLLCIINTSHIYRYSSFLLIKNSVLEMRS